LGVIFLTVLIDLIGFGIILPILPYYAQAFGAAGIGFGVLVGAFSGMQFLATAILGRLSDRIGRRPVILSTTLINAAGYVLFAFAGSYAVLLLARLISGFAGGNISAAQAYVADITESHERSRGMGVIGAAFGLGFVIGPALGGFAGHHWGPAAPGLVAAGLSLINCVLAWLVLPESLRQEHRVHRELFDFAPLKAAFAHGRLRPLMVVWFVAPLAFSGYTVMLPLHANARFGWREVELGVFFTVVGVTAAVAQGWLFGKLVRVVGDHALLVTGTVGMALGIAVVPFAGSATSLYAWTIVLALANSLFAPSATGMVSIVAGASEQGAVLGAAQSLAALGRLSGPEILGGAYDHAGSSFAFLAAGALMLLSTRYARRLGG
jgi:MFS family permease